MTFDFAAPPASAAPSQADVFKSIQQNVGKQDDVGNGKGLAWLVGGAGGLVLVLLAGSRVKRRQAAPQSVHHAGKLIREIMKTVPLKQKELKQLKLLVEHGRSESPTDAVESPLTLLLCPSVLARVIKTRPVKVDRAVLAQVIRKMNAAAS